MDGQINNDEKVDNERQYSIDEVNRVILGQSYGKEDGNAILMQALLKQNELLMSMLAIKEKPSEELYAPLDLYKILPMFD